MSSSELTDYWKMIKPSTQLEKKNPYLEERIDGKSDPAKDNKAINSNGSARIESIDGGYIFLENIACTDSKGNVFEHYPKLGMNIYLEKDGGGNTLIFTPYEAAMILENEGKFLPSMALTCNILEVLYRERGDMEVSDIISILLDESGTGMPTVQNTVISGFSKKVIHYPDNNDHGNPDGKRINAGNKRVEYSLDANNRFQSFPNLDINQPDVYRHLSYLKDLTGLVNPDFLRELSEFAMMKPALNATNSIRLSCTSIQANDGLFSLNCYEHISIRSCARSVFIPVEN